jgi:molybdate transport system substrate-binding protein
MLFWRLIFCASVLWPFAACGAQIRVGAAASLSESLTEAAHDFELKHGDRITLNFASSSLIARQIQEGARMDLFLSADTRSMDQVQGELEPGTRRDFLSNRLALILPKDSSLSITNLSGLPLSKIKRFALGDPAAVPAGLYGRRALEDAGLWERLQKRILPCENVRAALAAVEAGNAEAGIVYRTDAMQSRRITIASVITDPKIKIVYPVAILKGSVQKSSARAFLDFLLSPSGREIFERHGFLTLP